MQFNQIFLALFFIFYQSAIGLKYLDSVKHFLKPKLFSTTLLEIQKNWAPATSLTNQEIKFDHDEITYRKEVHIPQAERYLTKDWLHNLQSLPTSRLLGRIKGVVIFNLFWSIFVYVVHCITKFNSPGTRCHSLLGSALGLLLVFRTNTAYNRFWEGRKIWEQISNKSRDIARYTILHANFIGKQRVEKIFHLLCAFPMILQEHLQGIDQNMEVLRPYMTSSEIKTMRTVTNRPYYILNKIAHEIVQIEDTPKFSNRERQYMMSFIDSMTACIGSSERIVQTPVPLTYARHTSRFLSLFCLSAPIALVGEIGMYIIPFVTLMAWSLFGIQEIGMIIEEPFQCALKLDVFADTIRRDISDLIHASNVSPIELNIKSEPLGYQLPFFCKVTETSLKSTSLDGNTLEISTKAEEFGIQSGTMLQSSTPPSVRITQEPVRSATTTTSPSTASAVPTTNEYTPLKVNEIQKLSEKEKEAFLHSTEITHTVISSLKYNFKQRSNSTIINDNEPLDNVATLIRPLPSTNSLELEN